MPALLTFDQVTLAAPDGSPLFSDLTISLGRERVGLVGRNGSGKSSLLSVVAGEREPLAGTVHCHARPAMLRQAPPAEGTVADALGVAEPLAAIDRLLAGKGTPEDATHADWDLPDRIDGALARAGLCALPLTRPVASLSGGERTRLAIAAMLLSGPELLLLDEPTNNLDDEGRAAVAALLAGWPGGALIASHDRDLLEQMDRIVHLSPAGVTVFTGGWSEFVLAREAARDRALGELRQAEHSLKQQRQDVQRQVERKARRDKAGRALRARGGEPKLYLDAQAERAEQSGARDNNIGRRLVHEARHAVESARQRVEVLTPLRITLPAARLPANRTLLRLEDVVLDRDGRRLFGPLSLNITGPERVAISGPNGSGKTSLLGLATGRIEPSSGSVGRMPDAIAMLDQHVGLLDTARDLVTNMRARHPGMTAGEAHAVLARFAFRNRDALRPVATLSGGERLRAGLAMVTGGAVPPQLLILDEPTNHLDVEAVEMLESALATYDGALLIVSHDRRFLAAVGVEREIRLG